MAAPVAPLKIGVVIDTAKDWRSRFPLTDEQCGELSPQLQVEATVNTLQALGHKVDLVGSIFDLTQRLAMIPSGQEISPPWDLVFNVAEGMFGTAREAQVPALLEAFQIPCTFADATVLATCMDKALTKMKLLSHGVPTAQFFLIPPKSSRDVHYEDCRDGVLFRYKDQEVVFPAFPLFIKPNSEGSSKGINARSKIDSLEEIEPAISYLTSQYPEQQLLIEPFLAGRECSVGILGTGEEARVLGTLNNIIDISRDGLPCKATSANFLTYQDKLEALDQQVDEHIDSSLVKDAELIALKAHRILGLRDCSRFDIRYDTMEADAKPYILEANTIPGLVPEYSAMSHLATNKGMSFDELISSIVESARERVTLRQTNDEVWMSKL